MAGPDEQESPRSAPSGQLKPPEAQVEEIHKLVADAQEKLDQVSRALTSLRERVGREGQKPQR